MPKLMLVVSYQPHQSTLSRRAHRTGQNLQRSPCGELLGLRNGSSVLQRTSPWRRLVLSRNVLAGERSPSRGREATALATSAESNPIPRWSNPRNSQATWLKHPFETASSSNNVCWWSTVSQAPGTCRFPSPCPCLFIHGLITPLPEPRSSLCTTASTSHLGSSCNGPETIQQVKSASRSELKSQPDEQCYGIRPTTTELVSQRATGPPLRPLNPNPSPDVHHPTSAAQLYQ